MDHRPLILNPFVFPSETQARFKMLFVAALVVTWSHAAELLPVPSAFTNVLSKDELAKISFDPAIAAKLPAARVEDFSFMLPSNAWKTLRMYGVRPLLAISLVSVVLILGLAGYLSHPWRRRRALRSRRLTEAEAPALVREIRKLAESHGISRRIELEWARGMWGGRTFGLPWRRVLFYRTYPNLPLDDLGRAVVSHEMGHLVNRDVRSRELVKALWNGVVVVMLLVALAGALLGFSSSPVHGWLFFGLRSAVVCAAAWLIWLGLVRVREHYADWRVVAWNLKDALLQRLRLPAPSELDHPTNMARIDVVRDDTALFRIRPDLSFTTGLLLALITLHIGPLIRDLAMIYLPVMGTIYWSIREVAGPQSPLAVLCSLMYLWVFPFFLLSAFLMGAALFGRHRNSVFSMR